jgi:hypothetical protein
MRTDPPELGLVCWSRFENLELAAGMPALRGRAGILALCFPRVFKPLLGAVANTQAGFARPANKDFHAAELQPKPLEGKA